jgi:hypothetical protein
MVTANIEGPSGTDLRRPIQAGEPGWRRIMNTGETALATTWLLGWINLLGFRLAVLYSIRSRLEKT